jgi:hypothetical protein
MVAPTSGIRAQVLTRDGGRCVSCGSADALQMQHRARVGNGGSGIRPDVLELVTACAVCNARFEADLQTRALVYGWKVRTWVNPADVPVFNIPAQQWGLLGVQDFFGELRPVVFPCSPEFAWNRMRVVYGDAWDEWCDDLERIVQIGLKGRRS